jgi:hypothetical protein
MKQLSPAIFIFIAFFSCQGNEAEKFIQFNGVELNADDGKLELIQEPIENKGDKIRLAAVMMHFGKPFQFKNGDIYVPQKSVETTNGLEYLWNLFTKSNNRNWMEEHIEFGTEDLDAETHDLEYASSIKYEHPNCAEGDFGATGTLTINSKQEILFDTADSIGNGKFILVSSHYTEKSIYENYDSFLVLKNTDYSGFWVSFDGHFLDDIPTKYMYERKKIFVHNMSFSYEDTVSIEIPTTDSMTIQKLF